MLCLSRSAMGVAVALACAVAVPAGAATIVVQPSNQDAFIRKNAPNRIAGANPTNQRIRVQASQSHVDAWPMSRSRRRNAKYVRSTTS